MTQEQPAQAQPRPHWVLGLTSDGRACLTIYGPQESHGILMNAQEARLLAKQANSTADFLEPRGATTHDMWAALSNAAPSDLSKGRPPSACAAKLERLRENLLALNADAHKVFNNSPSETPQAVRDALEWYGVSIRMLLDDKAVGLPTGESGAR